MKDIGRLEAQMVQPVLAAVRPGLPVAPGRAPNPEAYDLYLKARALRGTGMHQAYTQALAYLNRAVEIDPNYSEAYAALAGVYSVGATTVSEPPLESARLAKAAAQTALKLDPSNGHAWAAEGYTDALILLDWKLGETELRKAASLVPQDASVHNWLGSVLLDEGRFPEAISELQIAERSDPLQAAGGATLGLAYYMARDYDRALQKFSLVWSLHPEAIALRPFIGSAWEAKGDYEKAMTEYRAVEPQMPDAVKSRIAHLLAVMGKRGEALNILAKIEKPGPGAPPPDAFDIAVIYGTLGERDKAFEWLDRAYEQRIVWFLKVHPMLDPLRGDARYGVLLRKAGLE
jgi:tetratricopeptide (TPR) repeat protein